MNEAIKELIIKFVNRHTTSKEEELLQQWLVDPVNQQLFKEYVQLHHAITHESINKALLAKSKESLLFSEVRQISPVVSKEMLKKTNVFSIKPYVKYAAAVLLIGMATFIYKATQNTSVTATEITATNNTILPGTQKAILTLENGEEVALDSEQVYQGNGVTVNNAKVVYENEDAVKKIEYNYLTVPRGGQYMIALADGTQVWLNSASRLKFPKNFIAGSVRVVELEYGEAYFDVSPSSQHQGASFKVLNASQEIEVLGTEFNVKAYADDDEIYTTLVEGSVQISTALDKTYLKPGQQAGIAKNNPAINVATVAVKPEISWKDGVFSFKGKKLKEIMKTLSRWYDVEVVFENKALEDIKFKGVIKKDTPLEEILAIMKSNTINNYSITNKKITIN